MSDDLDSALPEANLRRKRRLTPADWPAKKLRSRITRTRRFVQLAFSGGASGFQMTEEKQQHEAEDSALQADSSSSSCFVSVVTSNSSHEQDRSENPLKRGKENLSGGGFRPITRLYARQIECRKLEAKAREGEHTGTAGGGEIRSKHAADRCRYAERAEEIEGDAGSDLTILGISRVHGGFPEGNLLKISRQSTTDDGAPAISEASSGDPVSGVSTMTIPQSPVVSQNSAVQYTGMGCGELSRHLACSEQLSNGEGGCEGDGSEYSTCNEMTLSEFESELFGDASSDEYFSDLSQPFLTESSDNFSDKSRDDPTPSVAFALFLQLAKQFSPSAAQAEPPDLEPECVDEFTMMRFEDLEDEESYRAFRMRERRIVLYDYADEYGYTADDSVLVIQERLTMVNWIMEHSNAMQLQNETLFLGVSLMDRFLSRGFFRTKRNLHLLGIASATLATRMEENQPYNTIRRRTFKVGEHTYSRNEVVAMEWLVQEVLNFQCFLPTIYNFLWFYLKAARADKKVESLAKYLGIACLLDHGRLRFWPSTVAAGLVVLASLAEDRDDSCQWVMETHVRTRNDDLSECIKSLEWLSKHV